MASFVGRLWNNPTSHNYLGKDTIISTTRSIKTRRGISNSKYVQDKECYTQAVYDYSQSRLTRVAHYGLVDDGV